MEDEQRRGARTRGTVISSVKLLTIAQEVRRRGNRTRGTVVDSSVLDGIDKDDRAEPPAAGGFIDESGTPVSTEDRVATHVKFQRNSLIRQICEGDLTGRPSSLTAEPVKAAIKPFNSDSICVDGKELRASSSREYDSLISEDSEVDFLHEYGFTEFMKHRVLSQCSKVYHMAVLLCNDNSMKVEDGKCIQGQKKGCFESLPDGKRLANNADGYDLSVLPCARYTELQDVSFFLLQLAATVGLPFTLELFDCARKIGGTGKGFRRVLPQGTNQKNKPEDYIPHADQVESTLELIEDFESCITWSDGSSLKSIEGINTYCGENAISLEKEGKNVLAIVVTSRYPWGNRGGDADIPDYRHKFVELLNSFAELPVTFIFLVETRDAKILQFYDDIATPESDVKADVKIAKGLGIMIDGISKHNPWLNYCLPLHLCQVLGICSNILSRAASRPLNASEVHELCNSLIGEVPNPSVDMGTFLSAIETLMEDEVHSMWNPATCEDTSLINTVKLRKSWNKLPYVGFLAAALVCVLAIIIRQSLSGKTY